VFVCNSKVIGGAPFIDTYNLVIGPGEVFPLSARTAMVTARTPPPRLQAMR
jgi:hypothetical protein